MLASRRLSREKRVGYSTLRFRILDEKSLTNLLLMPWELIRFSLILIFRSGEYLFWNLLLLLQVFTYPFSFRWQKLFEKLIESRQKRLSQKLILWDNFFNFEHYLQFVSSIKAQKFFLKILFFPFFLLRFLFLLILILSSRGLITLFALVEIVIRFFVVLALVFVAPVLRLASNKFQQLFTIFASNYNRLLEFSLGSAKKVLLIVASLFFFSLTVILPRIGSELVPEIHQGTLYLNIVHPVGTKVERNAALLAELEKELRKFPEIEKTGFVAGTTVDDISGGEIGEHIGKLTINLRRSSNIRKSEEVVIERIRKIMENKPDLKYTLTRPVLFSLKAPIEVLIRGYNLDQLRLVSSRLLERIEAIPGLKDVQSSIRTGFPEVVIELDRFKLAHYKLNAYDVAAMIKNKFDGYIATRFKEEDIRLDIRVRLKENQRQSVENLRNIIVNGGEQIGIPLRAVAKLKIASGPSEIRRVDQERTAVISANVRGISLTEGVSEIQKVLNSFSLPAGFSYEIAGQNREMESSLGSLKLAMFLAIFLVYIVMASQFESFLHPLLIMLTVPMALIGVFLVLFALDIPLSITAYIGIITLVGIVVNNAIVLISYINLLREKGEEKIDAIKKATQVRLRPILMTTLTTVLGLLPMAFGVAEGTEIRVPMALTVIAGLLTATFLTLIVIPIVYDRFSR